MAAYNAFMVIFSTVLFYGGLEGGWANGYNLRYENFTLQTGTGKR